MLLVFLTTSASMRGRSAVSFLRLSEGRAPDEGFDTPKC